MPRKYDYWFLDLMPEEDFLSKRMFGGEAYYHCGKMVLVIFESDHDEIKKTSYKNKEFGFPIWDGVLFPVEREAHKEILSQFPVLKNHPVLQKWLYLPFPTETFDEMIEQIIRKIKNQDPLWGIYPKVKKSKKIKATTKIKSLLNLGKKTSQELNSLNIHTIADIKKLGFEKVMKKWIRKYPQRLNLIAFYALYGAMKNKDFRDLSATEKKKCAQLLKKFK
jgi:hypothetical protein